MTSYSIHFFTKSLSSFCNTCPYHRNLFCYSAKIMSSNPSLSLNPLLGTLSCILTPHIVLIILIYACWSATSFSFVMSQTSLPCNILLRIQLLYNLLLKVSDISLLVSNGTGYASLLINAFVWHWSNHCWNEGYSDQRNDIGEWCTGPPPIPTQLCPSCRGMFEADQYDELRLTWHRFDCCCYEGYSDWRNDTEGSCTSSGPP